MRRDPGETAYPDCLRAPTWDTVRGRLVVLSAKRRLPVPPRLVRRNCGLAGRMVLAVIRNGGIETGLAQIVHDRSRDRAVGPRKGRRAARIAAEDIVEGAILLHDHDHVIDIAARGDACGNVYRNGTRRAGANRSGAR